MEREARLFEREVPLWGLVLCVMQWLSMRCFESVCVVFSCLSCLVLSVLSSPIRFVPSFPSCLVLSRPVRLVSTCQSVSRTVRVLSAWSRPVRLASSCLVHAFTYLSCLFFWSCPSLFLVSAWPSLSLVSSGSFCFVPFFYCLWSSYVYRKKNVLCEIRKHGWNCFLLLIYI